MTKIDLVFARLPQKSVPQTLDLLKDEWLKDIDDQCARSFNGSSRLQNTAAVSALFRFFYWGHSCVFF